MTTETEEELRSEIEKLRRALSLAYVNMAYGGAKNALQHYDYWQSRPWFPTSEEALAAAEEEQARDPLVSVAPIGPYHEGWTLEYYRLARKDIQ